MSLDVDREQVIAYRVAAQELDRSVSDPAELAVLGLGVQDTPYGSARLALAARTSSPVDDAALDRAGLALVWSLRGAPHLHHRADLTRLAAALWPLSDADAATRVARARELGVSAFTAAAQAMHDVVTEPLSKGEVSTAVSARIPPELTSWCRSCAAQHIGGDLFQQVGLAAGVRLVPGRTPTTLAPLPGRPAPPAAADPAGTTALMDAYLRLLGPATLAEAARFLGTTQTVLRGLWPGELVEVRVAGRRAWLPEDRLDLLRSAAPPRLVRLLPAGDPYLQARDRALIVPDKDRQKAVWRVLGNPGAVFVDGEVAGTWRARLAGRALELQVTPFESLSGATRQALADEAERIAVIRQAGGVRVTYQD